MANFKSIMKVSSSVLSMMLLTGCAMDDPGGQGKEKEAGPVDPWALEIPQSNPQGKPCRIGLKLSASKVHGYRIKTENTILEPKLMSTNAEYTIRIEPGETQEDTTSFRAPFTVEELRSNGQTVLAEVPPTKRFGVGMGLIDKAGNLDLTSFRVGGATVEINRRIRSRLAGLLLLFPNRPVREGEVWKVPLGKLGRIMGEPGKEASMTGEAYQQFQAIEEKSGVACARVRFVFSLRKFGEALPELGGKSGEIRGKGEVVYWYALQGYVREAKGNTVSRIEVKGPGGEKLVSRQSAELVIQGSLDALGGGTNSPFKVRFETTRGNFTLRLNPVNAPLGVKRLRELVKAGFYDDCAFFRVIKGFVVQFGIAGNPGLNRQWRDRKIKDDLVRLSNVTGTIAFATDGPNTRTTQLFINLADNLRLDQHGFSPLGQVVEGMGVVKSLYSAYGDSVSRKGKGPEQDQIEAMGNKYLKEQFPKLDYIKRAVLVE